ncbi:hypothetical protein M3Y95_01006700 [Aphelenchoides besseyi]|nr:hypothetical protein M3Y95_01006700 [Aphelenchoides besseyi]
MLCTDLNSRGLFTTITGVYGKSGDSLGEKLASAMQGVQDAWSTYNWDNATSNAGTMFKGISGQSKEISEQAKKKASREAYRKIGFAVAKIALIGVAFIPGVGPVLAGVAGLGLNIAEGLTEEEKPDQFAKLLNDLTTVIDKGFMQQQAFITKALTGLKFDLMMLDYKLDIQAPLENYRFLIKYAFTPNSTEDGNIMAIKQLQTACTTGSSSITMLAQKFRKYIECRLPDPETNSHAQKLLSLAYRRVKRNTDRPSREHIDVHHILQSLRDPQLAEEHVSNITAEILYENKTFETKAQAAAHVLRHLVKRQLSPGDTTPCLPDSYLKTVEYEYDPLWPFLSAIVMDAYRIYNIAPFCAGVMGYPEKTDNQKKVDFFYDIIFPINSSLELLDTYINDVMNYSFHNELPNKIRNFAGSIKFTTDKPLYDGLFPQLTQMVYKSLDESVYAYTDMLYFALSETALEWRSPHSDCFSVTFATDLNDGKVPCNDDMSKGHVILTHCARYLGCRSTTENYTNPSPLLSGKYTNKLLLHIYAHKMAYEFNKHNGMFFDHWPKKISTPYLTPTVVIHTGGYSLTNGMYINMFPVDVHYTINQRNYFLKFFPRAVYTKQEMTYAVKRGYLYYVNPWDDIYNDVETPF